MPIGDRYRYAGMNTSPFESYLINLYYKCYGTPDLHSHIRWRFIKNYINLGAQTTLDIGCGAGILLFEMAKNLPNITAVGVDINEESIEHANQIKNKLKLKNLIFHCLDITRSFSRLDNCFEQVLLIDVLEHVVEDEKLIAAVSNILKPGGNLIISVPTPNYPKIFGIEFHKEIGHVRDGYWMEELIEMLGKHGLSIEEHCYYTYYPSATLCGIYYKHIHKKKLSLLVSPILNMLSFADNVWPLRNEQYACSALIKVRKEAK